MMLSYIIPTRDRPDRLHKTLLALGDLDAEKHAAAGGMEAIVIDNDSDAGKRLALPQSLANGMPVRAVELDCNLGAAARNEGARLAQGEWLIMLDDDSHPLDSSHIELLREAPDDLAAIGAEVFLPDGSRERGGLPEVFVGCGAAIRRQAFLDAGGYDEAFEYYAEEYDLCAKLILRGWRIEHDFNGRFHVLHEKTTVGRNFNAIVHRLARNNAWVMQRYAPDSARHAEIAHIIERYAGIAMHERAARGFAAGMSDLTDTLSNQPRTPMSQETFDRFSGLTAVRRRLDELDCSPGSRVALIEPGKNAHLIACALREHGCVLVDLCDQPDHLMIATLSPGPMRDAGDRRAGDARVLTPFSATETCGGDVHRVQQSTYVSLSP
jgi:GT2 family glycosyltransferase